MKKTLILLLSIAVFTACSNNQKKILVITKGKAVIDKDAKTITATENANNQEEQTIEYNTADKITLQVKSQAGEKAIDISENGYYVLNAKPDTIIGSYQSYSAPKTTTTVISQDQIKHSIDSLQQLLAGNASAANRNFYLPPNSAVKITDNMDAYIITPFHQVTSIAQEGDKAPEVYRFYTIKDVREFLSKLQSYTVAKDSLQ